MASVAVSVGQDQARAAEESSGQGLYREESDLYYQLIPRVNHREGVADSPLNLT